MKNYQPNSLAFALLLSSFFSLAFQSLGFAQGPVEPSPGDFVWDGGGSTDDWGDMGNWSSAGFPVPGSPLVFAGNTRTNNFNERGAFQYNIRFDSGASAFTLNAKTLSDSIVLGTGGGFPTSGSIDFNGNPNAPVTHTITMQAQLGGATTITTQANGSIVMSGPITQGGTLQKAGDGTLTLSGNNSYTNTTTVSAGTLNIQHANALGTTAGGTSVSSDATLSIQGGITTAAEALTLNGNGVGGGGALRNVSNNNTYSGAITLGSASRINSDSGTLTLDVASGNAISGTNNVTFGGAGNIVVADAIATGTGNVTKDGAGNLTLTANHTGLNAYSGATTINQGTLQLGNGGTTGSLNTASSISLGTSTAGTFAINRSNTVTQGTDFSGNAITGLGGITQAGTGTTILNASNSYSGTTTVSAGTLNIQNGNALGNTTGGTTVSSGATLAIQGGITTAAEALTLNGTGVSSGGALRNISGDNAFAGAVTVAGSDVRINSDAGTLTLDVAAGNSITGTSTNLTFGGSGNVTVIDAIDIGSGGITKDGTGTLTLAGNNSYSGSTTISSGTVNIQNNNALGNTTGGTIVASGATLAIQGGITTAAESLTLSGNGVSSGGALQNVSGNNTFAGAITLGADTRINSASGTLTLDVASGNAISGTNRNVTFGGSGDIVVADAISTGNGTLTKDGSGKLTLTGTNTYSGTTTISGGSLQVGNNGNTGSIANTSSIGIGSGSSLIVSRSDSVTQADVLGSGVISGQGSLIKTGSGTLTLTEANSYTGGTLVSEGTLIINGNQSAATGAIIVANNAVLSGSGTFGGSLADTLTVDGTLTGTGTITSNTIINGTHSPGNSPGSQTFAGNLTYTDGSIVKWELISNTNTITDRGTEYDGINVGGNLSFTGNTQLMLDFSTPNGVDWTNSFWSTNQSWLLYDLTGNTSAVSGFGFFTIAGTDWIDGFNKSLNSVRSGASFTLDQSGSDVIIRFDSGISSVPEPGSLALMSVVGLFGGGRLAQRYLRRRKNPETNS